MSSTISGQDVPLALGDAVQCLTTWHLNSNIVVASAAVILYEWLLTSSDEMAFLWRRRRSHCARILVVLARYPALVSSIVELLPPTNKLNKVATSLRFIAISSSELIFVTRTWAIWERSRRMLAFLVVLLIVTAAIAVRIPHDITTVGVAPSVFQSITDLQHCQLLGNAVTHEWAIPYIGLMVFQAILLALTLYKVLRYHRRVPKQSRSRLLHVIWTDGVMYFIFMLLLGILNVILILNITGLPLRGGVSQLQAVFQSVLSTRIAFHTAKVLKQDIVDSRSTSVHYRVSRMEQGTEFVDAPDATVEVIVIFEDKADIEAQNSS